MRRKLREEQHSDKSLLNFTKLAQAIKIAGLDCRARLSLCSCFYAICLLR
jgi:hypothetical protein